MSESGTYVLVVDVPRATTLEVGALGERDFADGTYAYVGSAFGPGGFARIDRHRELARGERDTRHWHIDYLLGHDETRLEAAVTFPDADRECELATSLPGEQVDGFGASDCDCAGHLLATSDAETIRTAAVAEGGRLRFE
ncbi:GIY-YIG nuclease family protein [Haloterrigena sp. SYSU A558-1]|uniref:GIY-YIG nuclease family protein n=1 Tax=Haloterrigena gelatinilytica TaxID=2741724 RepID=A0A8J8KDZ6_9EURY|nr:GIY-YIG nuclease family protein [Haloterrigena gelatinilytica]NUB89502.1 GIY-YIG nuclease family protein [Haloterrigena gelatinilytica]NUC74667.1 GIY-YIG nuclease family protein [Haloterrigena gelatinilytica]